jgi:hypothetical protein
MMTAGQFYPGNMTIGAMDPYAANYAMGGGWGVP